MIVVMGEGSWHDLQQPFVFLLALFAFLSASPFWIHDFSFVYGFGALAFLLTWTVANVRGFRKA